MCLQREALKWKLTTRRPDGASEEFHLNHAAVLGGAAVKEKEVALVAQVSAGGGTEGAALHVNVWAYDVHGRRPHCHDCPSSHHINAITQTQS